MSGARVLLIDDHAVVRHGLAAMLRGAIAGIEIAEAADVDQAEAQLAQGAWDLVVVDINLPRRSGLSLVEALHASRPELPVLVLSAYPESSFAARSFQLGARGYITKSSAADELVTAVRHLLAGQRYASVEFAEQLQDQVQNVPTDPLARLSKREIEVLRLLAQGRSLKIIAAELNLSEKTIATYRARLGEKLKLSSNVELTRFAVERGVIDPVG